MMLVLLLGSDLGNRQDHLNSALENLSRYYGMPVLTSSIYESEPWGFISNRKFLNQVVAFDLDQRPLQVLERNQEIERLLGRERKRSGYSSRTIDIDILFYGNRIYQSEKLTIPHPKLHLRRFCLLPLAEVLPDFIHPVLQKDIQSILKDCTDELAVEPL